MSISCRITLGVMLVGMLSLFSLVGCSGNNSPADASSTTQVMRVTAPDPSTPTNSDPSIMNLLQSSSTPAIVMPPIEISAQIGNQSENIVGAVCGIHFGDSTMPLAGMIPLQPVGDLVQMMDGILLPSGTNTLDILSATKSTTARSGISDIFSQFLQTVKVSYVFSVNPGTPATTTFPSSTSMTTSLTGNGTLYTLKNSSNIKLIWNGRGSVPPVGGKAIMTFLAYQNGSVFWNTTRQYTITRVGNGGNVSIPLTDIPTFQSLKITIDISNH